MIFIFQGGEGRRSRRSVVSAKQILNNVQSSIGNDQYKKLLAYNGGVTLGFVFDTTGSMDDEMDKAKTLARGIVNFERLAAVDYALSPFNDPVTDGRPRSHLHCLSNFLERKKRLNSKAFANLLSPYFPFIYIFIFVFYHIFEIKLE